MFPNLRAEMARRKMTIRDLHERMAENGYKISLSQLSQKISGKYEFTLEEAEAVRGAVGTDLMLDVLFEREAV